jgi:hypothetical protein
MRKFFITTSISLVLMSSAVAAPPKQLYGKSATISWLETRSQRDGQSGPFKPVGLPYTIVFYISTEGRLFARSSTRSPGGAGSVDRVGMGAGNGEARNVAFSGNRILSRSAFQGAARQIEVNFDQSFSSCTAHVITAIPKGAKTAVIRSMTTGNIVEFESVSAGPASCSISSGNSF